MPTKEIPKNEIQILEILLRAASRNADITMKLSDKIDRLKIQIPNGYKKIHAAFKVASYHCNHAKIDLENCIRELTQEGE